MNKRKHIKLIDLYPDDPNQIIGKSSCFKCQNEQLLEKNYYKVIEKTEENKIINLTGLGYKNLFLPKSIWAKILNISESGFENACYRRNNDLLKVFKTHPQGKEWQEIIDKAIMNPNSIVYQPHPNIQFLRYEEIESRSSDWAKILGIYEGSFGSQWYRAKVRDKKTFKEYIDSHPEYVTKIKQFRDSNYQLLSYLRSTYILKSKNSLLTNVFPEILKLALNIGYSILDSNLSYIYKQSFKISKSNLNNKEIMKFNNREFIKC